MKNKTTQGLGNKTLLSFPKYDSNTEDKSNVNSHLTMQCSEIQHNTTQHNTTQHNTTQHNTTQHNNQQASITFFRACERNTKYACKNTSYLDFVT